MKLAIVITSEGTPGLASVHRYLREGRQTLVF